MVQLFQWNLLFLFSFLFCEIFAIYDTLGWISEQAIDGETTSVAVSADGNIYASGYSSGINGMKHCDNRLISNIIYHKKPI